MNIGAAARQSGVSAKMIRYYESIGLIPAAARSSTGYRTYKDSEVETLRFIGRARDLGFSVKEITELLALWRDRSRRSADVKRLALEHIGRLQAKIHEIESIVATLSQLASCCHGDERPECPILDELVLAGRVPVRARAPQLHGSPPLQRPQVTMLQLRVPDMMCDGCARSITAAVHRVDPRAQVSADPAAKTVKIDSEASRQAVIDALAAAGFPAEVQG